MPEKPLVVLLDGNALVHRAYHAIPPLSSPHGEPTNATFGFTSTLLKVLADLKPEYGVIAFDIGRTFRHDLYPEYKATRAAMPDDLRAQFSRVREMAESFHLAVRVLEGYEADDILATLARSASEQGLETIIVTGDTDTLQLVNPHVKVLLSGHRFTDTKLYDEAAIRERFGLEPHQLIDYKVLKGDTSDNVPGIPGVGDVTARKLLQQHGSVERLLEHLDSVDAKLRSKLEQRREELARNRELIELKDRLPVDLALDEARLTGFARDKVVALFRELGFTTLVQRLPKPAALPEGQLSLFGGKPSEPPPAAGRYHSVDTFADLQRLVAQIRAAGLCAVDVETTSVRPVEARLVGIALACEEGEGYYIPLDHSPGAAGGPQLSIEVVQAELGPLLADAILTKYAHNAIYDLIVLHRHGLAVRGTLFDSMVAAYLLNPSGRGLGLKDLTWQMLGVEMTRIDELLGKGKVQRSMADVPVAQVVPYAAADADMTLRLARRLEPMLRDKQLWALFSEIEMPLVPVLMDMECQGVALDVPFLKQMSTELDSRLNEIEIKVQNALGHPLNLNSSQQLSDALFVELGLPTAGIPKGTSGRYSTAAEVLDSLKGKHPVIDDLLEHRQLSKIKSTYVDALPTMVNAETGRLHTSWNQTGVVTGRISSSEPNLQNIPIRTELGRRVRQAFTAPPGHVLLGADYSQVELRILAHLSGDENLLAAFARGEDVHARTAASILELPLDQVTPDMRRLAKTINFGLIYGMSNWGLAVRTELSQQEATDFIGRYFAQFPKVQGYLDGVKQQAAERGYVETLLGRKRYFPELQEGGRVPGNAKAAAQRMAINHPIQGTAADIIKIAMINLYDQLGREKLASKIILQVHDELVLEVPDAERVRAANLVKTVMEGAYRLDAPLRVDVKTGKHWGEME